MAVYDKETNEIPKPHEQDDSSNLEEQELDSASTDQTTELDDSTQKEVASLDRTAEDGAESNADLYKPSIPSPMKRFGITKRQGIYGGVGVGLVSLLFAIIAGVGFFLPYELVHIKEMVSQKLGGVQENINGKRRMRVFNRAYFFRKDGEFDGYKSKGSLFNFLENRKSQRIVNELREKGYKIDPEIKGGRWTGRFKSIRGPDGKIINNTDSIWARRSALRSAIGELHPEKSQLWRTFQTSRMYARYGWNRTNWWSDNAATRKLTDLEERWRSKLKSALKKGAGTATISVNKLAQDPNTDADNAEADKVGQGVNQMVQDEADDAKNIELDGDLVEEDLKVSAFSFKGIAGSIFNVIKLTGKISDACDIKKAINAIINISRFEKALQLARAASTILAAADGIKAGKAEGRAMDEIMHAINSIDPKTRRSFFASGGMQFFSSNKKKIKPAYANTYDTGGGLTGILAKWDRTVSGVLGGGANIQTVCKIDANVFVQIGSGIAGVVVSIFSGGTFTFVQLGGSLLVQVVKQFILYYATVLTIKAAAGTIVNGFEKGEKLGDLFSSGSGVLFASNGGNMGMRPMTKKEYAYQQNIYLAEAKEENSQKSILARYFDPSSTNSVTGRAIDTYATNKGQSVIKTIASIPSMLFSPLSNNTQAATEYNCEQADIKAANIQTDPFCNPLVGNTDEELDKIDPLKNVTWMVDNGYSDGDGVALPKDDAIGGVDYEQYTKDCFENEKINTLFVAQEWNSSFTSRCFDKGANADGFGIFERYRAFRMDSTLLLCLDKLIDEGHCEEDAAIPTTNANSNMFVLGDSITQGMRDSGGLESNLKDNGWTQITIDAECGRPLGASPAKYSACPAGTGERNNGQGAIVDPANKDAIRGAGGIIVALGTNELGTPASQFGGRIEKAISSIKAINSTAKIYWVDLYASSSNSTLHDQANSLSAVIKAKSAELGYTVISWNGKARDSYFAGDPYYVHPIKAWDIMSSFVANKVDPPQATTNPVGGKLDYTDKGSEVPCADGSTGKIETGYVDNEPIKVRVCNVNGNPFLDVNSQISGRVADMFKAAKADGKQLTVSSATSAFRTMDQQRTLYNNDPDLAAKPGTSNHQMGFAMDLGCSGAAMWQSACETWLKQNGKEFGFYNKITRPNGDEAWHWSVDGY